MPRLREFFGLLQVCLLCEAPDESADFGKMDRSCLADRATWFCFQQHIDERTALKDFFRNQPSNTSKIASNRASGLLARRRTSDSSQSRVHTASLRSRNAIASSTLLSKLL